MKLKKIKLMLNIFVAIIVFVLVFVKADELDNSYQKAPYSLGYTFNVTKLNCKNDIVENRGEGNDIRGIIGKGHISKNYLSYIGEGDLLMFGLISFLTLLVAHGGFFFIFNIRQKKVLKL